jgi:hypothetical protein
MNRLLQASLLATCLSLGTHPQAGAAESVLDHLPDDALGFVVIRNLGEVEQDVARLWKEIKVPLPTPLAFVRATTGLGSGIDPQGDALLAFLPGGEGPMQFQPLLMLPVADYDKLSGPLGGDPDGEICRVVIAGQEVLLARDGDYALLMNLEHEPTLQRLVQLPPEKVAALEPLQSWIADNDLVVSLMPAGVQLLLELGKSGVAGQRAQYQDQFSDPDFAELLQQMQQTLSMAEALLGIAEEEIEAAAVGISIDAATNVRLSERFVLKPTGSLADASGVSPLKQSPLADARDQPFVAVGGGPIPESYADFTTRLSVGLLQQFPQAYGFEDLEPADWEKLAASTRASLEGLQSMSVVFLPGSGTDPLYSNFLGTLRVEDSAKYLASYQRSIAQWNSLMAKSSSDVRFEYEVEEVTLENHPALLMKADISAAVADPNVPQMSAMMEAMFGKDGIMRIYLVAVDEHTLKFTLADEERTVAWLRSQSQVGPTLDKSPAVVQSLALINPEAAWTAVVSPQGCVVWFKRMFDIFSAQFGGAPTPNIPPFPDSPPWAFSFHLADRQFQCEMAWPIETIRAIANYVREVAQ